VKGCGLARTVVDGGIEKQAVPPTCQPLEEGERFDIGAELGDDRTRRRDPAAGDPLS